MAAIDWSNAGTHLVLASAGVLLIVLGVLFYLLPAARLRGLALVIGVAGGLAAGCALGLHLIPGAPPVDHGQAAETPPPEPRPQPLPAPAPASMGKDGLERFRQATPAERMALLKRLSEGAATWYTVERGDVNSLVERGSLESADNAEVVVKVRAHHPNSPATSIRWLVDDGATVKKGQLLVELDDEHLQKLLKVQKMAVENAKNELALARKQAELDSERAQLFVEEVRHQLALAERDLKAYTEDDAERKKGLELNVKAARQHLKTREFQTTATKIRGDADQRAKQAVLDGETAKAKDIESEIAACKLYAPRDGVVVYHVELRHMGPGSGLRIVAAGEPVDEGQKLMSLPDLSKMQVVVRIPESQIFLVRRDQSAVVRVDAFPNPSLSGKVIEIGRVPQTWFDAKVYSVKVALPGEKLNLKPGMSAEVRIRVEPHRNVLRVPARAVRRVGQGHICFVKVGAEVQERPVKTGLSDNDFVEIADGLIEGDPVLRDPCLAAKRLTELCLNPSAP